MKRLLVVLALLAAAAFAQSREEALRELERTDDLIARAAPTILESGVPSAIDMLRAAERAQGQAWNLFGRRSYRLAIGSTEKARDYLERAAELARGVQDKAREEIQKTARKMREWKSAVLQSRLPRALELWRLAEHEQESAIRAYQRRDPRLAVKLTITARLHAFEAHEVSRRTLNPDMVREEVERTDADLRRAREQVKGIKDRRIHEILHRASEFQREAVDALRDSRYYRALKMTLVARDLLDRGRRMVQGAVRMEAVELELEETDRLLETWSGEVESQGGEEAAELLAWALERQQSAWESFGAGRYRVAWKQTGLAQQLLARAVELAGLAEGEPGPE